MTVTYRSDVAQHARALVVAFLFSASGSVTAVHGQSTWPDPGARIRLTVPCSEAQMQAPARTCVVVGELLQVGSGAVTVATNGSSNRYSLDATQRIEVSRGFRSYSTIGAIAGFGLGLGVTHIVLNRGGSTSKCDRSANQDALNSGECLGLTALGGLAGAGLGYVVGGFIRSERWEAIPLERIQVGVTPQSGISAGVRLTW